jgi:hypothetical protein
LSPCLKITTITSQIESKVMAGCRIRDRKRGEGVF